MEVAISVPPRIHLRESDHPHDTAAATPHALAHLLHAVKRGGLPV
ncbi:hypothetical protein [Streptomyces antibioticus]